MPTGAATYDSSGNLIWDEQGLVGLVSQLGIVSFGNDNTPTTLTPNASPAVVSGSTLNFSLSRVVSIAIISHACMSTDLSGFCLPIFSASPTGAPDMTVPGTYKLDQGFLYENQQWFHTIVGCPVGSYSIYMGVWTDLGGSHVKVYSSDIQIWQWGS